jgi:hypothetical protein
MKRLIAALEAVHHPKSRVSEQAEAAPFPSRAFSKFPNHDWATGSQNET